MFERRRAIAAEKLLLAAEEAGELPAEDSVADPVAAAVVRSLDAKLDSIDDLIARLEIEEGEVIRLLVITDIIYIYILYICLYTVGGGQLKIALRLVTL